VTVQTSAVEVAAFPFEGRSTSSVVPLMQLKEGGQKPPVFLAHGIGGDATDFCALVSHFRLTHPIYAMHAKRNDAIGKPLRSIEEMASVYLAAIKRVQPEGPYLLVGYSLGGLVSLEVAQRLCRAGDRVPLLTLVDCYPHQSQLSTRQRYRLLRRRMNRRALSVMRGVRTYGRHRYPSQVPRLALTNSESFRALQRLQRDSYVALRRYRPRFYEGSIRFIKAAIPTKFPDNPTAVWAHLAAEFESETVPGDHVTMLSTHSDKLASLLTRHITSALPENPCRNNQK
jgi:thioesterase domain-containing protein